MYIVAQVSHAQGRAQDLSQVGKDKLITDPSVNEAWFSPNNTSYSSYSLRLHGTKGNIMTLYFKNYKTLMKWANFIRDPATYGF